MKKFWAGLFVLIVLSGCGGGGGDIFVDDPFFDDFVGDLIAIDDQYSTFQNQALSVGDANGVLGNDIICCDDFDLNWPTTTASGGTIVGRDDGSFIYTPPTNFTGTDFFDYELEDDYGVSVGNVIIAVNEPPQQGFFVDSSTGSDATGSGTSGAPFATLQAAVSAAGVNGTIIVRVGDGSVYPGAVVLLQGQTLVADGFQGISPQGAVLPRLAGPITMHNQCRVQGVRIEGGQIDGILRTDGEILDCEIDGFAGYAIDLDGAEGTWRVESNSIQNCDGGLAATLLGLEQLTLRVQSNDIRNNSGSALLLTTDDSAQLTAGVFSNIFQGNQNGFTVDAQADATSSLCLDLVGNQNDDVYRLTRNNALFQVEQFSQLTNLNTGTVNVTADAVLEVADGFCGF